MQRRHFMIAGMSLGLGLALAACETQVSVPRYADITFRHRPEIALDVAKITVVQAYQSPGTPDHVEGEFPVPPMRMAANWARDRLKAVGNDGELVFTIREAPVIEVPLNKSTGLTGLLTVDQGERYEAKLVVEMSAANPSLGKTAGSNSTVERKRTVAEDVTLNEREGIWYKMTEEMAADLDSQMEGALDKYFGAFLR
ncbi:hypothetical protein HH303_13050 [Rhodospirillaceae bacterium KN72]|uniref:Lipoprotein n=1 Tax=Pacificispira spongiicola TaxID=2729598 RepID=A0A7Y0HHE9_9PROT|nr:hypothetical protein [Pacificispira spongiicola]NMM45414.1 hypothetical protein [Pacificispira spongiicola]